MDAKLFEVLGKYAGLAGISVGFVLLVFRAVLKKNIFPKLNTEHAYLLIRLLLYLTFATGVIGILSWVFVHSQEASGHVITGHVIDKQTRRPITGAEITLGGRAEMSHSDGAGNFTLTINEPLPAGAVRLYVAKDGYDEWDRNASVGQNLEAELTLPKSAPAQEPAQPPVASATTPETYWSDEAASGACKDFGAWTTVCSPDKPQYWTIVYQHFELTGDRAGCAYAECGPVGAITDTKVCYHFRTQGHDEECGHSGNTGIHYSKGKLDVVWKHP